MACADFTPGQRKASFSGGGQSIMGGLFEGAERQWEYEHLWGSCVSWFGLNFSHACVFLRGLVESKRCTAQQRRPQDPPLPPQWERTQQLWEPRGPQPATAIRERLIQPFSLSEYIGELTKLRSFPGSISLFCYREPTETSQLNKVSKPSSLPGTGVQAWSALECFG